MEIAQRLQQIVEQKAQLDTEAALLAALPQDLDVTSLYQISGEWHLTVAGKLPRLLELLPPCNCRMTLVGGMWMAAPEDKPLDWNQRVLAIVGAKSCVEWYFQHPAGLTLRVSVPKARLPAPEGYELAKALHNSVLIRKTVPLESLAVSPDTAWTETWDAFMKQEGYTTTKRTFAILMRQVSARDQEITSGMLPVPVADTLQVGDATLQILRSSGTFGEPETIPEGSPFTAFPGIGHFWSRYTEAEAARLVAFANTMRCNLAQRQSDDVSKGLANAVGAIAAFQELYLGTLATYPDAAVLTRFVQEQTGYPVEVSLRDNLRNYPKQIDLGLYLWGKYAYVSIDLPSAYSDAGFDFQNPAFYQYVPNNQRFFEEQAVPA